MSTNIADLTKARMLEQLAACGKDNQRVSRLCQLWARKAFAAVAHSHNESWICLLAATMAEAGLHNQLAVVARAYAAFTAGVCDTANRWYHMPSRRIDAKTGKVVALEDPFGDLLELPHARELQARRATSVEDLAMFKSKTFKSAENADKKALDGISAAKAAYLKGRHSALSGKEGRLKERFEKLAHALGLRAMELATAYDAFENALAAARKAADK